MDKLKMLFVYSCDDGSDDLWQETEFREVELPATDLDPIEVIWANEKHAVESNYAQNYGRRSIIGIFVVGLVVYNKL